MIHVLIYMLLSDSNCQNSKFDDKYQFYQQSNYLKQAKTKQQEMKINIT